MNGPIINLGDVLNARRHSEDIAIIDVSADGQERSFSCLAIDTGARAVGAELQARGIRQGTPVGILADNSVEYLMAYLGIMQAGCVCVPINTKLPPDVIDFICRDASIEWAFSDRQGGTVVDERIEIIGLEDKLADPGGFREAEVDPEDTALVLYTSGSTGRPKGVVLSHRSQLAMVQNVTSGKDKALFHGQTGIVSAPMFHMNALVFLESFLLGGGCVVLMAKFNAVRIAALIKKYRVNVITGVPTMITLLHDAWPQLEEPDLSSITTVYIGSAPVTEAIVRQAKKMMPGAGVINSYGTTESGGGLYGPHPDGLERPPTAVGYPHKNVELRLVGDGHSGVLQVRTASAMTAYLNLPELTAAKMQDGWIDTGDLFRCDENGFHYFLGRVDDMFVCSGENIYPGEVEKAIESHPEVIQACVVPVPDRVRGQMPVAWVVAKASLSEQQVQQHVQMHAAPYLYPRRVWFLDALPLAGTGKIDRKLLAERAVQAVSDIVVKTSHAKKQEQAG
ncbi:MAG: long-chain fatty acid--CoA ligase [Xanthomonadales bacterium]|nr:long-chain fatty acid--CoA ligase [Xanthomonadales bacterium]